MQKFLIIVIFMIVSALLQHISHEMLHVIVGKYNGLKLIKIQWFTYHGGTKVFFEDEPNFTEKEVNISKEWMYMSAAGIVGTSILAYMLFILFNLLPLGYLKLFMWVLTIFFLLTDSGYAVVGSLGNFGDTYLVRKYFGISRMKMTMISAILFLSNCSLVFILLR